jgi:hypothetical protein
MSTLLIHTVNYYAMNYIWKAKHGSRYSGTEAVEVKFD